MIQAADSLRVVRLSQAHELAPLEQQWNALAAGVPFRSYDWLAAWWDAYSTRKRGNELFVLAVFDRANALVGLAPWYLHNSARGGRVIRFLGSGEVCSDYLSLLALPGREDHVVESLAAWLDCPPIGRGDTGRSAWDMIALEVERGDHALETLADCLRTCGHRVHVQEGPNCWRLELPATWDEYLAALSKSHRKQLRQFERRYFETGRARLCHAENLAQLEPAFATFRRLHQARRESLGQPGCFVSQHFAQFVEDAARRLLVRGDLRLCWVELDGKPVAIEYHLVGSHGVFAYQAGIDTTALEHEPGRLITLATVKQAIEEQKAYFDFLRGDEPYKAHWRAAPRPTQHLRIINRQPAAQLRHHLWLTGLRFKTLLKSRLKASASHTQAAQ